MIRSPTISEGLAPHVRQANRDWGNRTPVLRFIPDQDRLNLIGLSPSEAAQQMLLNGIPVTQVCDNIRNVPVVARAPAKIDLTLRGLPTFL